VETYSPSTAVALVLIAAVAIPYRYAPNVVVPWRWIFLGSLAFAVGWLVATAVLGLYVSTIGNYGATYGSLAGVIVMLLWFYVTAAMLLIGAELAAAVARERTPEQIRTRREEVDTAAALDDAATNARTDVDSVTKRLQRERASRPST